ncbi:hypothetical protein, partial, partial [Parasitella parasitica]
MPPQSDLYLELERQKKFELVPVHAALRENSFEYQIVFHNIQSFSAHHSLVSPDVFYIQSDILLFAETWTTPSQDTNVIPSFDTVARVDVTSGKPAAYGCLCLLNDWSSLPTSPRSKVETLLFDDNGHSLSISGFVCEKLAVFSIYATPNFSRQLLLSSLKQLLQENGNVRGIFAGDFNVDFSKHNELTSLFATFDYSSSLDIHSTTNNGSFIDNIFTNITTFSSGRYISFTSLHDPLYIQFDM